MYEWKKSGEPLLDKEVQGTVKFEGGSLMVWGCMGWNGMGILAAMEGRMDAEQYVSILMNNPLPNMENSGISEESISFNRIMTLNTPPKGLKTGLNLKKLGSLTGQHSYQTSALFSISGNIKKKPQ